MVHLMNQGVHNNCVKYISNLQKELHTTRASLFAEINMISMAFFKS